MKITNVGVSVQAVGVRGSNGLFVSLVVMCTAPYTLACAAIHARIWPACQAVTPALNLVGLGNLPVLTMRHSVGAEKGSGATALSGLLQLRTSWDSRSQALSGSASKAVAGERKIRPQKEDFEVWWLDMALFASINRKARLCQFRDLIAPQLR